MGLLMKSVLGGLGEDACGAGKVDGFEGAPPGGGSSSNSRRARLVDGFSRGRREVVVCWMVLRDSC